MFLPITESMVFNLQDSSLKVFVNKDRNKKISLQRLDLTFLHLDINKYSQLIIHNYTVYSGTVCTEVVYSPGTEPDMYSVFMEKA